MTSACVRLISGFNVIFTIFLLSQAVVTTVGKKGTAEEFLACRTICGDFLPHRSMSSVMNSMNTAMILHGSSTGDGGDDSDLEQDFECYPQRSCKEARERICAKKHGGTLCSENWDGCWCGYFHRLDQPRTAVDWQCVREGSQNVCALYDKSGHNCLKYGPRGPFTKCDNHNQGFVILGSKD